MMSKGITFCNAIELPVNKTFFFEYQNIQKVTCRSYNVQTICENFGNDGTQRTAT